MNSAPTDNACVVGHDVCGSGEKDHNNRICYTHPLKKLSLNRSPQKDLKPKACLLFLWIYLYVSSVL